MLSEVFNSIFSTATPVLVNGGDSTWWFGEKTKPTVINYKASLKLSAVYNAVDQISNDIAKIPFSVYQKSENQRNRITSHPVDVILHEGPNGFITSFMDRKAGAISLLLRGNALWQIITNNAGKIIGLDFIHWDQVKKLEKVDRDTIRYTLIDGTVLLSSEVVHLKWFSFDGILGVSVITYAATQMGLATNTLNYSAKLFNNRGLQKGVIETEQPIASTVGEDGKTTKQRLKESFSAALSDESVNQVAVLDLGMKYKPIAITPQEAQIVEMSRFNIEDIARWFNIAPHKIKSLQQSTNNNIEQQSLDHVSDTIQPLVTNWEQEYAKKLLTRIEKAAGYYIKANMNAILRSDIKSRGEFFSKMFSIGAITANEIRNLEDLPQLEGLDDPFVMVNMQKVKNIDKILNDE
jgi:HK97 family phage portal protein